MQNSLYEHQTAEEASNAAVRRSTFELGVVDTVVSVRPPRVRVRLTDGSHVEANVHTLHANSGWCPTVDSSVVVGQRVGERPTIIGTFPKRGRTTPTSEAGARIIGHGGSDSTLVLKTDGSIDIIPDGASSAIATIDSSGIQFAAQSFVKNISTTKDADGHVTSIDVTYGDTLSL